jgi:hypothetical protein
MAVCAFALSACGGGGTAHSSYTIGGTVSGLAAGEQVTISDNGVDSLTVTANGAFTFSVPVAQSNPYAATVSRSPSSQTCTVANGSGTVGGSNVSNVQVLCSSTAYAIGGTVNGLAGGSQLTLLDNGGDATVVTGNGVFAFSTAVSYNSSYAVAVGVQPSGQTCSVSNGSGGALSATVTNVNVICSANTASSAATQAAAAQLSVAVNLASNTAQLSWADTFPTGVTYDIQAQTASGSFVTVGTQAAGGTNTTMTWQQSISISTSFQVTVAANGQSYTLLTAQGNTTVLASVPASSPAISVSPNTSTLSGTVILSLTNATAYPNVTWFCDVTQLGVGSGTGDPISWNTAGTTNGTHLLLAVINLSGNATVTVRQQVSVSNSNLVVNASAIGTTGSIQLNVLASSSNAITLVSATLDGASLGSLTSPNSDLCGVYCGDPSTNFAYQFIINAVTAKSGTHTIVATATDSSGASQSTTLSLVVNNPPLLSVTSPVDGGFVDGAGSLSIAGTTSSDKPGGVTVTALLGALPISITQPTGTSFSGQFSVAGLPPGSYVLTLYAVDSANVSSVDTLSIIVASSAQTVYSPLLSLGSAGRLLAADGTTLLYQASDGSCRVRDTRTSTEVTLAGATSTQLSGWQQSAGYTFVQSSFADCATGNCIYQWDPAGTRSNLSNNNPNAASGLLSDDEYPRAHDGYVLWSGRTASNVGNYTLYNVANKTYTTIPAPAGVLGVTNTGYDFAVNNGVVEFFYPAWTSGTSTYDLYSWNSNTQVSSALTSGGMRNLSPQTDGQRVAWNQFATTAAPTGGPVTLLSQPAIGGATTTVSGTELAFTLADGVLAWFEGTSPASLATITGLKASTTSGAPVTISTVANAMFGVGGGFVVYEAQGRSYVWNSVTSNSTLLIDVTPLPSQTVISGATMYFTLGTTQTVYQVTLH